jgi:hypothetical protein
VLAKTELVGLLLLLLFLFFFPPGLKSGGATPKKNINKNLVGALLRLCHAALADNAGIFSRVSQHLVGWLPDRHGAASTYLPGMPRGDLLGYSCFNFGLSAAPSRVLFDHHGELSRSFAQQC